MTRKILNNQNGVALLTSLMIMSLLTIVGISALNTTNIELKIAGNEKSAAQALYAAEAGIHNGIAILRNDPNAWDNLAQPPASPDTPVDPTNNTELLFAPLTVGAGVCAVIVYDNPDDGDGDLTVDSDNIVVIRSTGRANGSEKTIEVVFTMKKIGGFPGIDGALGVYDPGGSILDFFGGGN